MAREEFQYTLLRVVPRIERGERLNVGVVLYSPRHRFLAARVQVDRARLAALDPQAPADDIERHLASLAAVAAGEPEGGPVAGLPQGERFHWLAAPASTAIQASEVHTGFCEDPQAELDRLFERLVG
jgi:hypothetical protein